MHPMRPHALLAVSLIMLAAETARADEAAVTEQPAEEGAASRSQNRIGRGSMATTRGSLCR